METKDISKNEIILAKVCIINTPVNVTFNKDTLDKVGQGEGKTKWKGWGWKKLLLKIIINYY